MKGLLCVYIEIVALCGLCFQGPLFILIMMNFPAVRELIDMFMTLRLSLTEPSVHGEISLLFLCISVNLCLFPVAFGCPVVWMTVMYADFYAFAKQSYTPVGDCGAVI